jgi:hypothetical protein
LWLATQALVFVWYGVGVCASPTLTLEVRLQESPMNNFLLHIKLTNRGRKPLSMYEEELPWRNRWAMFVTAVAWNGKYGRPLEDIGPVDDPVFRPISIAPGQTLEGDIRLNERFPDLIESLQKGDLIFFWVYELWTRQQSTGERHIGSVQVSKRTR